ncbi:dna mismatch repair protein [Moniliophthora roreri]|nr:dna mismatch repair protein [Moniliophthora roreri]
MDILAERSALAVAYLVLVLDVYYSGSSAPRQCMGPFGIDFRKSGDLADGGEHTDKDAYSCFHVARTLQYSTRSATNPPFV